MFAADRLFFAEPDGQITPAVDDIGLRLALAGNRDAVFGLFARSGQVELWRVERSGGVMLQTFDEPFVELAASDSALHVLRFSRRTLVVQQLTLSGELGERVTWDAPSSVAEAELRTAADQVYVVVSGNAAPWMTLGRIAEGSYEQLRDAQSTIAGPIELDGATLIALDGMLERLQDGAALKQESEYVQCLASFAGVAYACVGAGLKRVDAAGLGEPLFELAALREPDTQALPEPERSNCHLRWRDFEDHLAASGLANASGDADAAKATDVSAAPPAAGCSLRGCTKQPGWLSLSLWTLLLLGRASVARLNRRRER